MSTNTTNYGLIKQAGSEPQDVSKLNTNFDTIDTEIKAREDENTTQDTQLARLPYAESAGDVVLNGTNIVSGGSINASVNFPVGRFTQPPIVVCSMDSGPAGSQTLVARALNATKDGCTVYLYNVGSATIASVTSISVAWHAKQMKSTSGAG